ncbi:MULTISPECIES: outer membrane protein assembly factor BamD [Nonlabens]|uniref:Beta-barrel assembly machine subunit BamD n=1 Tax=Nonlabens xylanidelens TaxID=191564 RepID=A0A2S6IL60_9FLAO|nr:outer membrane protein assembly factor BamD [Nonlabens xylanidelens]PPK94967.1 Beta-barrel assembly machine subunit BamD [Nonlabens xylanidelens]PQJ17511.1 outer membrane protein assembly factor BamD [Nonlabens xylanidelens]
MKNLVVVLIVAITLASCSSYQKALKSEDNAVKVAMIDTLFAKGKYGKSLMLFEQIIPVYRGTDSAAPMAIKYAKALYEDKSYVNSAYQYERFIQSHPANPNAELALFMAAKSHYQMSPIYSKDQNDTNIALAKLQEYINLYPSGQFADETNLLVDELRSKLDKKAYETAKQYHHFGNFRGGYISAISAFENFIVDHPGSEYQDDAQYYLLESQYEYAMNSFSNLVPERLALAKKYYDTFAKRYPDSEYKEDADNIHAKIEDYNSKNTSKI